MKIVPFEMEGKYFKGMMRLYCQLFAVDPGAMQSQFLRHSQYPGFEGYLAIIDERVAGYIYGYSSRKGQYYHDLLARHLYADPGWMKTTMELVELGVDPRYRGKGIARQLVARLIHNRREEKVVLTTRKDNEGAVTFYENQGFRTLRDGFYPNVREEYIIMGKELQ
ncbi:GNAT family N-acetyltransferase [Bacillus sp. KH172YL63]|uniref:GNAT family N-acetyltransferase n=1 Tax=Bacillus sp. KH172YL63 TaxID=2709784 RepID=UPI0013E49089|nr:GNAT family N-acetyltransferase [Bacillus sp. KH172YL63]BCB05518.1 hypothetical protein KH172YL63_36510 [Bacillus sp. KH172YL63]